MFTLKPDGSSSAGTAGDKHLLFEHPSPIALAKAIKNQAELAGMHEAHLRDSVALAQTFHWLEQEVSTLRHLDMEYDWSLSCEKLWETTGSHGKPCPLTLPPRMGWQACAQPTSGTL